ncbi:hypothetical protein, partial [Klebsiella pneumoniae]|uniref:hypothetical protein n=1 Tax=Klebsiella pneumoniae TaxID=573 RepID=UPI001C4E39DC
MAHDVPLGCAPDEYDDLISGTCSHLPLISVNAMLISSLLVQALSNRKYHHLYQHVLVDVH